MTLDELQHLIATMYSRKDSARGIEGTFMWFMEEVGELSAALREETKEETAKRICGCSGLAGNSRERRRDQSGRCCSTQVWTGLPRVPSNGLCLRAR